MIAELDADVVALQEFSYPADIALETRTPVVLTALERYECALGPTLTRDGSTALRQRAADAPPDPRRCSASTSRWTGASRAARWR